MHVEEDAETFTHWSGCSRLGAEVGDRLSSDGVIMVFQGKEYLGSVPEQINMRIHWYKKKPNKENKVKEGIELERL